MIGIINYGLGNVQSFINSYRILGLKAISISKKEDFKKIERLILPGVGSFDEALKRFNNSGLADLTEELVLEKSMPILGICVGLQMMARSSEEGLERGLGWLDADVKAIKKDINYPLPHMGWNNIRVNNKKSSLLFSVDSSSFYFLHSYHLVVDNKADQIATADYGNQLLAAASKGNIYGCQFHPEKSHSSGLKVLENFAYI